MKKTMRLTTTLLIAGSFVVGCGPAEDPGNALGLNSFPIINGSAPNRPEHDAVVSLHQIWKQGKSWYVSPNIFCSGTLIAPDVVLTAAHCMTGSTANKVGVYVGDNPTVDITSHLYRGVDSIIHPQYNSRTIENDIALLRIEAAVTETGPVPHLPQSLALGSGDVGIALNFAGFGEDENGNYNVKLQFTGELAGYGCGHGYCSGGNPDTQIWYYQDGNGSTAVGGPCSGDSGGPAFVSRGGSPYVAGITSYGDAYCDYYGVSTKVDAFSTFIEDWVGGGGTDPGPGPGDTCGDAVCDATESCDGRNGTSACIADCPGVTKGKPSGRYCYVGGACEGPGC